ncbi:response regulator [Desulfomicrobium escambiense]|uniref:response regulator n=1 Tax=Desulfomicrobium escambiense TaxID=29503 RepID=UPI000421CAC2|nr:response regulator [Desulfomicrobium escambiense]
MKPKILFVDDEQNILDSLRLSLRNMRGEWDMTFALGGRAALDALAQSPHDVVVSDMRMPGMDGAELLKTIQYRNPEMARIILSGYSDREGVLKNICLAHQYLSKPCRTQDLVQAINKALDLHGILAGRDLKRLVARIETLPVLPSVYTELVATLADKNAPLKRVGDILARDMALTASVLRVVNCSFFGFSARVSSIHQAATLLGTQTLRTLVLSTHLFSTLEESGSERFSVRLLWDHCIRVAGFAKCIAEKEGLPDLVRDDCFIAAMLHDIGKLILRTGLPQEFRLVLDKVRAENCPVHVAEMEILGTTHAEVGAYLLGLWGFSHEQMGAVRWHQVPESGSEPLMSPQTVLHIANSLDHELVRIHEGYAQRPLDDCWASWPDWQVRIDSWRQVCMQDLAQGAVC